MLLVGQVPATELANKYGTPLYVYDAAIIRRQIDRVKRAFANLPFRPFYAMKANGSLAILELIRKQGGGPNWKSKSKSCRGHPGLRPPHCGWAQLWRALGSLDSWSRQSGKRAVVVQE